MWVSLPSVPDPTMLVNQIFGFVDGFWFGLWWFFCLFVFAFPALKNTVAMSYTVLSLLLRFHLQKAYRGLRKDRHKLLQFR